MKLKTSLGRLKQEALSRGGYFVFQILSFSLLFLTNLVFSADSLTIQLNDQAYRLISSSEILEYRSQDIDFYNRITHRMEKYRGIPFLYLLNKVAAEEVDKISEIELICENNFHYYIPISSILTTPSILSYMRADGDKFVRFSEKQKILVPLGPFYLIWDLKDKKRQEKIEFPSVYQIKGINLLTKEKDFGLENADLESGLYLGYQTYKRHCISCHSLKKIGGDLAANLIQTKSLKRLGEEKFKKYILDPKSIEPKTKMLGLPNYVNRKEMADSIVTFLQYVENPEKFENEENNKNRSESYSKFRELINGLR